MLDSYDQKRGAGLDRCAGLLWPPCMEGSIASIFSRACFSVGTKRQPRANMGANDCLTKVPDIKNSPKVDNCPCFWWRHRQQ